MPPSFTSEAEKTLLHSCQKATIFSATVYGTAEFVAEDISLTLSAAGIASEFLPQASFDAIANGNDLNIFCVSTTGEGALPRRMQAIYDDLAQTRPDLSGMSYFVIVLGDSSYGENLYCRGGRRLNDLLEQLGAKPLLSPLLIDGDLTNNPEEIAAPWIGTVFGLDP